MDIIIFFKSIIYLKSKFKYTSSILSGNTTIHIYNHTRNKWLKENIFKDFRVIILDDMILSYFNFLQLFCVL